MPVATFRCERTLLTRLASVAHRLGTSRGNLIREALRRELAYREQAVTR